jgi:hypothetical protein
LAISWLNVAEFTHVTDPSQAEAAEALVDSVLPNIYFTDADPLCVIERENELLRGIVRGAPHEHREFFHSFFALRSDFEDPLTANELFRAAQDKRLASGVDAMANQMAVNLKEWRLRLDRDAGFRSMVMALPRGRDLPCGTRYLLRELLGGFLRDRSTVVTGNHAIDLMHTVVPSAYCDLVLLDGHWEVQVDRARERIRATGMVFPIARAFSARRDGINRFLFQLSGWNQVHSSSGSMP